LSHRPVAIANRHPRLRLDRRAVARAVRALDRHHEALALENSVLLNAAELSVVFMTDRALAGLHSDFLGDPAPTDVITFAYSGPHPAAIVGEICISADAARRRAGGGAGGKESLSSELTLYLVHGWLHLAGHDDRLPAARKAMRRAELLALELLKSGGALPGFSFRAPRKQNVRAVRKARR
jgi:probable rRNA maturation factor